jgi:mannose-6-phosphate isomerase-like protein (cupin superfamily)
MALPPEPLQTRPGDGSNGHGRRLAPDTYDRGMNEKVNLAEKFALFDEPWQPKIVGELNDTYVKIVKLEGAFVWHHHDDEDELFWVVSGRLRMELRDGDVILEPGELLVVPKGVEHRPVAEGETHVVLVEPKTTLNTGNVRDERTVDQLERI